MIIALQGRVPVKVTGKNGPISVGDYLTSSDIPGYAEKAITPGRVVAIAMQAFSGATTSDQGKVLAFVEKSYYPGVNVGQNLQGGSNTGVISNQTLDPNMVYSFANLHVQNLTVGSADAPTGFTIYDTATKQPFCVEVENGTLKTVAGNCNANISTVSIVATPPVDTSTLSVVTTTTVVTGVDTSTLIITTTTSSDSTTPADTSTVSTDATSSSQ